MSPLCQVLSLQMYCLHFALTNIHLGINSHKKTLRKLLISSLHGGIRQQLIDLAIAKYQNDLYSLMDIIGVLADSTIRRIEPRPGLLFLSASQSEILFNKLEESGCTGLQELIVKVELNQRDPISCGQVTSSGLHSLHGLILNGLAKNLRVLVLRATCDNHMLMLLGEHAIHLTTLDVSSNWLVDDLGIRHLILKDPNCLSFPPDSDSCEAGVLCELATLPRSALTAVCFSLHEVRIQDTNTSGLSVFMLLLFIKHLKSLGGFIYYRNIGDAILTVEPYRPQLELTDLWDTHLPPDKVMRLSSAIPHLSSLYTRASQLPQGLIQFDKLANMTIDFDFCHFGPHFTDFLTVSGGKLKKLVLIDQIYSLDLTMIAHCCPLLVELGAKVTIADQYPSALLPHLKVARLRFSSAETFRWLMLHADNVERLELLMEEDEELRCHGCVLDHKVIVELSNCQPPSFSSVEFLSITLDNSYVGNLDCESIKLLVASCKRLRYLGDLHSWCGVQETEILSVVSEMVTNNLDIDMRYQGISLTGFYRHNKQQQIFAQS